MFEDALAHDEVISSRNNPLYKLLNGLLTDTRTRRKTHQIALEGVHLIESACLKGLKPAKLILSAEETCPEEIAILLKRFDLTPVWMEKRLLAELSQLKNAFYCMAIFDRPTPPPASSDTHFALFLESVQDPGNVGSILRSAAAAGVEAVFCDPKTVDCWSPKVLRAGMGAHFSLTLYEQENLIERAQSWTTLKKALYVTTLQQTSLSLFECDLTQGVAFVVGNEGSGVSDALKACATRTIHIPMHTEGVESLNVAAATAICLFERVRQHL